jgi:hypothetical protein
MNDIPKLLAFGVEQMMREMDLDFDSEIEINIRPGMLLGTEIQITQTKNDVVSSYQQIMKF